MTIRQLPGLELVELVARTNLNEVWRGVRQDDGAVVAVKIATTANGAEMLRGEADAVRALLEAGIAGIVPAEYRHGAVPHLVMPWKGGRTLRDALEAKADRAEMMATLLDVINMVARAHRAGVLHGDLKPENVLIDGQGRAWLADFGMARAIRSARLESHISMSMSESEKAWGGTLNYLPPEGLHGDAPAVPWDVYALGVMLHEILLGRRPDRAATPERLKSVLPEEVVDVLIDALAYAPKDRIPTAQALLSRLQDIGEELTATGAFRGFLRLRRFGILGLAAFFVALRYGSVAALAAAYVAILPATLWMPPVILLYIPFVMLHAVVRWEGPETNEEAARRTGGRIF